MDAPVSHLSEEGHCGCGHCDRAAKIVAGFAVIVSIRKQHLPSIYNRVEDMVLRQQITFSVLHFGKHIWVGRDNGRFLGRLP